MVCAVARMNALGQPVGETVAGWTPRPAPVGVVSEGRCCRVEPLNPMRHGPDLYSALHADISGRQWTYMPYGPFPDLGRFRSFLRTVADDPAVVPLAVVDLDSGQAQGMASYGRIDQRVGSVEVGGVMFGPGLRRSPGATEAMYLMASYVFDRLGYRRYEWKCDALNAASTAAAGRLGFSYEGTWRNATIYKGRSRDTAWFAMTSDDWTVIAPTIRGWLAADNFIDGQQRTALSELIRLRLNPARMPKRSAQDA